ncbi:hypothetical protein K1719_040296 [Acacia pycnantha]|nr:hypothetical protein K1719_040296 [Acacia pycnantha]
MLPLVVSGNGSNRRSQYAVKPTSSTILKHNGVAEFLEIMGSIINGFALPLKEEHGVSRALSLDFQSAHVSKEAVSSIFQLRNMPCSDKILYHRPLRTISVENGQGLSVTILVKFTP